MTRGKLLKTRFCLEVLLLICCLVGLGFIGIRFAPPGAGVGCLRQGDAPHSCLQRVARDSLADILRDKRMLVMQFREQVDKFINSPHFQRQYRLDFLETNLADIIKKLFPDNPTMDLGQIYSLASTLLKSTQDLAITIAKDLGISKNRVLNASKLLIQTIQSDTSSDTGVQFQYSSSVSKTEARDTVGIPVSALKSLGRNVPVAFFVFEEIGSWMQPTVDTAGQVNTHVISASVEGLLNDLAEPVRFVFAHLSTSDASLSSPRCSFWQPEYGEWRTTGCEVEQSNQTHTSCLCRHLTSFAVLMAVSVPPKRGGGSGSGTRVDSGSGSGGGNDTDGIGSGGGTGNSSNTTASDGEGDLDGDVYNVAKDAVLVLITKVLTSLSIVALLLSFLTFVGCRSLKGISNTIHINLVLCLGCGQLLFLVGVNQVGNKTVCAVIAGFLHFLFLGAFCWMFVEGLQIYKQLVIVYQFEFSWLPFFCAIGYGVPVVIVVTSAIMNSEGYGTDQHCWLSTDKGFYWSFVGPVIVILAFNTVMLGIAMRIIWHHLQFSEIQQRESDEKVSKMIKGCASLSFLLGTGWLFGGLQNVVAPTVMAYLFTIFTCSQGIFIFVFHCLSNRRVHKEYRKKLRKATWMPKPLRKALYGLVSTPSTAELEVETSYAPVSGTVTQAFQSVQEAEVAAETSTPVAHRNSIENETKATTEQVQSPEETTPQPEDQASIKVSETTVTDANAETSAEIPQG